MFWILNWIDRTHPIHSNAEKVDHLCKNLIRIYIEESSSGFGEKPDEPTNKQVNETLAHHYESNHAFTKQTVKTLAGLLISVDIEAFR